MQTSIMLPVKGDKSIRLAIRKIACDEGVEMGEIVREALEHRYGLQLEELVSYFDAKSEQKNAQMDSKKVRPVSR